MTDIEIILDLLSDLAERIHEEITGLSQDVLDWRPDSEANSIALTLWHIARAYDLLTVRLLDNRPADEELWHINGWRNKTGYDPRGIGWDGFGNLAGYTQEEVADVPIMSAADLLAYFDQAYNALCTRLGQMSSADFHQISAGFSEEGEINYFWVKNFMVDSREHLGEIKAIKAMWARKMQ